MSAIIDCTNTVKCNKLLLRSILFKILCCLIEKSNHADLCLILHSIHPFTHLFALRFLGMTLYDACESNEVELGPLTNGGPPVDVHSERWTEPVFGEGPTSGYDHVVLSGPGVATANPMTRSGT